MIQFPFPFVKSPNSKPLDGYVIKCPKFCSKANPNVCQKHYSKIWDKAGIYTCPYGFTSYVLKSESFIFVFSGLNIEKHTNEKKIAPKIKSEFNPKISLSNFKGMISGVIFNEAKLYQLTAELDQSKKAINEIQKMTDDIESLALSLPHEIRKLNGHIKSQAEEASREILKSDPNGTSFLKYRIDNIFASSSLISLRLETYDFEFNPDLVFSEKPSDIEIYKKFEKVKHCLHVKAKESNIKINFTGECYISVHGWPIIEFLPFLIIENAIKFSPQNHEINVVFDTNKIDNSYLTIKVSSIGPRLYSDELDNVFEKKYRGKNAKSVAAGTGIGLYFAKAICDIHNINISVNSASSAIYKYDSVEHSMFTVTLSFVTKL